MLKELETYVNYNVSSAHVYICTSHDKEEIEKYRRLIANSPTMYELLINCAEFIDDFFGYDNLKEEYPKAENTRTKIYNLLARIDGEEAQE